MTTVFADREHEYSRAVIIFAKRPVPGIVKTRLSPPLTPEEASELYTCMLEDTLETARSLAGLIPVIFFQDDSGAAEYFASFAPGIQSIPQKGDNLGERMWSAFEEIFRRGYKEAVIIGTDSPDLPPEYIFEAFTLLEYEHTDVVFGPAEDGGYYLLALKRVWAELFTNLPWSCENLLAASVEKAKDSCLGVALLPEWHDIDTAADLLRPELHDVHNDAARTVEFLKKHLFLANNIQ